MKKGLKKFGFVMMTIGLIGLSTLAICLVAAATYINLYISPTIDISLDDFRLNFTSFVYYVDKNTGEEVQLSELHGAENRVWVDYEHIPQMLIDAFISIEDARFMQHKGVDWKRTIGAMVYYVVPFRDSFGGGSTITQQLIKNLTGDNETSVRRKIQEIMRALELERKYEKEDIIEMYLNTIYLGQGANGVKTAAMTYFGKELDELTIAECASLAGITKNPSKNDIIRFPEFNKERRMLVLSEMYRLGKIDTQEYEAAKNEDVSTENGTKSNGGMKIQSYFMDEVVMSVTEDLMREKGYSRVVASQLVTTGGLKIITTFDPRVQEVMDKAFLDEENIPGSMGKDGSMPQTSMLIMDPYNGHVLAMYGGRGEKTGNLILNRATRTKRSPGSAIKPLTVYAPALEYGVIVPSDVMTDEPKNFTVRETGWPKNYYNYYRGQITMLKALEISNNPVPVEILTKMGLDKAFSFASINLGLNSLVEKRTTTNTKGVTYMESDKDYSPLALGGLTDGLNLEEMAAAYSAFTNNGIYTNPVVYTKVYNSSGQLILDNTPKSSVVMQERTATYMLEMLRNVVTGPEGTGRQAALKNGIDVGAKTGTTNNDYDRWFVGITPYYSAICWFGYDMPQPIKNVSMNPALSMWLKVMPEIHEGLEPRKFNQTVSLSGVSVCSDSGKLPTEWCLNDIRGSRAVSIRLAQGDAPSEYCTVHVPVNFDSSVEKRMATEYCPKDAIVVRGAPDLKREYARSGISIRDQESVLPYYPSNGLYSTVGSLYYCTVHSADNDGNAPPVHVPPETPGEDPDNPTVPPVDGENPPAEPPTNPPVAPPEDPGVPPVDDDKPTEPAVPAT